MKNTPSDFNTEIERLNKIANNMIAPWQDRVISLCRLHVQYTGDIKEQSRIVRRIEEVARE